MMMNRKQFIKGSLLASGVALFNPLTPRGQDRNPVLFSPDEIDEFVGAAHRDLDETKKIIDQKPRILNCASQVERGDFETAVGGSSHMGRKDITGLLVARGARLDIFNLTFLGHTDMVQELVEAYPELLRSTGPHGFTLLHHAKMGKHEAFEEWLIDQGLEEDIIRRAS